jgi:hypothetical protein
MAPADRLEALENIVSVKRLPDEACSQNANALSGTQEVLRQLAHQAENPGQWQNPMAGRPKKYARRLRAPFRKLKVRRKNMRGACTYTLYPSG